MPDRLKGWVPGLAAPALLWALAAEPLSAQVIRGVLLDDESREPIEGARIQLLLVDHVPVRSTLTDAQGRFHLAAELGTYLLEAQRLGYGSVTSQEFRVTTLDTLNVTFHVSAQAILLDPIVVGVPRVSGRALFEERMARGEGVFMGPDVVDSLRPQRHAGEIFAHADGMRVRWGWGRAETGRTGPVPRVGSYYGRRGCLYWVVDRTLVPDPFFLGTANEWGVPPLSEIEPEDLVAIEIYRHWGEVPGDFERQLLLRNGQEQRKLMKLRRQECGVAVIWTDRGW